MRDDIAALIEQIRLSLTKSGAGSSAPARGAATFEEMPDRYR
jgi:hypothetical protein